MLFVAYKKQLYLEVLIITNRIKSMFSEEVYLLHTTMRNIRTIQVETW